MTKQTGTAMVLVSLVAVLLAGVAWAQPSSRQARAPEAIYSRLDGGGGAVLRSGGYRLLTQVGQPVSGRQAIGGLWQVRQRLGRTAGVSSLEAGQELPQTYGLSRNYPNPFRGETTIEVLLPAASRVELVVYDVLGREVARLLEGELGAGRHAVVFEESGLSSGVYVYRLVAGAFTKHRTMLLVK